MVSVPDLFGSVVQSMRLSGEYTAKIDNGDGTFNYLSPKHGLTVGKKIEMENTVYTVIAVPTADLFTTGENLDPPMGLSGPWQALDPYYLFGHRLDISNRLLEKDKDNLLKFQKYPLIALRLPIQEDLLSDGLIQVSLNVAILEFTDENYHSEERYSNVITPILTPIYEKLLEALQTTSYFSVIGTPEHQKFDRLFWGIEQPEGNQKYIFNDPLDAIELVNLNLNITDFNC